MRLVRLCPEAELEIGAVRRFSLEGEPICLAHCEDGFYAISDTCSHEDFSLSEGELDVAGCEIECWKHGSMFSLRTGEPTSFPATQAVATYELVLKDGEISVVLA